MNIFEKDVTQDIPRFSSEFTTGSSAQVGRPMNDGFFHISNVHMDNLPPRGLLPSSSNEGTETVYHHHPHGHHVLPLRTPDKKLSENSAQAVRKRALLAESPSNQEVEDPKKRNVSRYLHFDGTLPNDEPEANATNKVVSRCLFGPPSVCDNEAVKNAIEGKIRAKYVEFVQRWGLVDGEEECKEPTEEQKN